MEVKKKKCIITIVISTALVIFFIFISFGQKPEIVKVGEIPKAFNFPNNNLPIMTPKTKQERENAIPSVVSENTIYLTFDDGPSTVTNKILDILKNNNVPATFFVMGTHIYDYQDTIRREYQDGHTVALHTNTHNYQYVYTHENNYFEDLNSINNKVYEITGHRSHIVRFPGGSSNTVSKKYNPGVVTRIANELIKNDYFYFDWNADSGDASGKLNAEQIYHNTTLNLKPGTNIVLMHDTNAKQSTADALDSIIKYGKEKGYTFARITRDTLPIKHHINN